MKTHLFPLICSVLSFASLAQAQTVPTSSSLNEKTNHINTILNQQTADWRVASHMGGLGQDRIKDILVANDGAVFTLVDFSAEMSAGSTLLPNMGKTDLALIKTSALGHIDWIKTLGGPGNDYGYNMALDADGNIYLAAAYTNLAKIDSYELLSNGYTNVAVIKVNPLGNVEWIRTGGSTGFDFPGDIKIDNNNNVVVTGWYTGIATFSSVAIQTQAHNDVFIAQYSSEGDLNWIQSIGGAGSDVANALVIDSNNNYYVGGQFEAQLGNPDVSITANGNFDAYIAKFDDLGNLLTINSFGGELADVITAMTIDKNNRIYVAGFFSSAIEYQNLSIPNFGNDDAYVAQFDEQLNLSWFTSLSGPNWEYVRDLALNADETRLFAAGYFSGSLNIDNNALVAFGGEYDYDVFVAELTPNGSIISSESLGGLNSDFANRCAVDKQNNLLVAGDFYGTFAKNSVLLSALGGSDAYMMSYNLGEINELPVQIAAETRFGLDTLQVVLQAKNADKLAYLSYEMTFNPTLFTYVGTSVAPEANQNSLFLAGELSSGKIGVSLGKYAQSNYNGDVLTITFVRNSYAELSDTLRFSNIIVQNENMIDLENAQFPTNVALFMPKAIEVWPGDTNTDGIVGELDVLNLGYYWTETGAARINASLEWKAQWMYPWENESATHSDTDGSGQVNQNDLRGLLANFGKTNSHYVIAKSAVADETTKSITYTVPALLKGETKVIELFSSESSEVLGLTLSFVVSNIDHNAYRIKNVTLGEWSKAWTSSNKLISVVKQVEDHVYVAFAYQGKDKPSVLSAQGSFVKVEIEATSDWNTDATFELINANKRNADASISNMRNEIDFAITTDTQRGDVNTTPTEFEILGNYPNPFNPSTHVRFSLKERADVRITVYDVQGRAVAELLNSQLAAGIHDVPFFAANISSGTYVYKVIAGNEVRSSKMTLVK